jgi:hypothetical protein
LAPVKQVSIRAGLLNPDPFWLVSVQNPQAQFGCVRPLGLPTKHTTADKATTDIRIHVAIDGSIGLGGDKGENLRGNQNPSGAVLEYVEIINDAPVRKMRNLLQEIFQP